MRVVQVTSSGNGHPMLSGTVVFDLDTTVSSLNIFTSFLTSNGVMPQLLEEVSEVNMQTTNLVCQSTLYIHRVRTALKNGYVPCFSFRLFRLFVHSNISGEIKLRLRILMTRRLGDRSRSRVTMADIKVKCNWITEDVNYMKM